MFDFDRVIDRRGTHASKWDNMAKLSGITAADGIPMWVADMDFAAPPGVTDALAEKLNARTKIVFFCSPHNPGGTVWSSGEIRALASFCAERNLILVSDEIHCDLRLGGVKHTPTLSVAPEIADRLITCLAATKTFNLAGAHVGACV